MELKDKVVVITGAGRGFGKCFADILIAKGAKVVAASLNIDGLTQSENLIPMVVDVTKREDVQKLSQTAIDKFGRIDIWINNAGVWLPNSSVEDLDMQKVRQMFEVNVFGLMYGSIEAIKQMKKQKFGIIMNMISSAALSGRAQIAAYAASKFAADGFTKSINVETKEFGIKVIAVYPGGTKTHLFDAQKPGDFETFMEPVEVANKIIANLEKENPEEELILKRPAHA